MNAFHNPTTGEYLVELNQGEILDAVCIYVGNKLKKTFKAEATLDFKIKDNSVKASLRFTEPK